MKIFLGAVLAAFACCPLALGQEGGASDGRSRERRGGEEKIAWGEEVLGLAANLRAHSAAAKPGEPIEFEIRVKNVSKEEQFLWGHKKPSPFTWRFHFGQWEWRPPAHSLPRVTLKPGETVRLRCLVATTRESLSAEQKERLDGSRQGDVAVAPFRHVKSKRESARLPAGLYRVQATTRGFYKRERDRDAILQTNTIEVRIGEDPDSGSDADVSAARTALKDFLKSRKPRDLVANPDLVMERAKKVSELFRRAYPYRSLRNRLEYETKNRPGFEEPKLSRESAERLDRSETSIARQSVRNWYSRFRPKSLEMLHSDQVAEFIARQGFGRSRMPSPPSPIYWELPAAPTIPLAAAPKRSTYQEGSYVERLPKRVTRYDMLRLHAGEPTWTDEQVENTYYKNVSYDYRMKAMFEAYSSWKAKHNPLNMPSRNLIFDSHDAAVINFAGSGRNGHVKDLDHVAGFGSHAMTETPRFEPGPIELRYWPKVGKENPVQWLVTQLQLVSLLKHDEPGVYVSNNLPKLEELEGVDLRPLNGFESDSLKQLFDGEHLALDVRANRIRMLGAVRAGKQCIQCHQVKRGELLGAFSYELVRARPAGPPKRRDAPAN